MHSKIAIFNYEGSTHQVFRELNMRSIVRAEVQCADYLLHQRLPSDIDEYTPFEDIDYQIDVNLLYEKNVEFVSGRFALNSLFSDSQVLETAESWYPSRFFRQRLWR